MSDQTTPLPGAPDSPVRPTGREGFLRQSAGSVLIKGVSVLLSFATVVLLARILGQEGYGVYAVVFATVSALAIPASLGAPNLIVRETARAKEAGQSDQMRALWRQGDMFVLASSSAVLLCAGLWLALAGPGEAYYWAFLAGLALVPLRAFIAVQGAALRGLGRVLLGQFPDLLLRPGLLVVFLLGFSLLVSAHAPSAAQALCLHGVAAALALLIAWLNLRKHAPLAAGGDGASPMGLRAMAVSSGTMGLIAGIQVLNSNLDVIMLGALRESAEAGVYKVAANTSMLAGLGLLAMNQIITPRIAACHKRGDLAAMQTVIRQGGSISLGVACAVALVLFLAGGWFLGAAFGSAYASGYSVLVVLTAGQLLIATFGLTIPILNMTGHERDTLRAMIVACIVNVVLNAALIPPLGGVGAAIATGATTVCWSGVLLWRVRQRLGINPTVFGIPRG